MRNSMTIGLAGLAVVALAGAASAQLTPIGPFTGDHQEGFLNRVSAFPHCLEARVFDNNGDLCTFDAAGLPTGGAHITGGWGFNCSIGSNLTPNLFGSASGIATYTFDRPIGSFGGYFGTNGDQNVAGGASVEFYDTNNVLIGSDQIRLDPCGSWNWYGWESASPIETIRVIGAGYGGAFVMMDDMEMSFGGGTVCYPDCDGNTVLDFFDFLCFQNAFLAGDPYADCDGNTVLDFFDFLCFQNEFLAGC